MLIEQYGKITTILGDCMDYMTTLEDNAFDLAIVDPPYGLNFGKYNRTNKTDTGIRVKANKYHLSSWDNYIPQIDYFKELFRVSSYQIIWGGNYFELPATQCFIFWYKQNPVQNFADGELAWTSFSKPAKCFDYRYGNKEGDTHASKKIHPTQKPVALYKWILQNFAKEGHKILDTHGGSMSHAIACHDLGFELTIIEKDEDYYREATKRLKNHQLQQTLF